MRRGARSLVVGTTTAALIAGVLLAAPGASAGSQTRVIDAGAPAAIGSGQISNDELVVANLTASGLPDEVKLISRIVTVDVPEQTIADPASVTNVKYLDRLGRPQTVGTNVMLPVGGPGQRTVLTEARFDKPLPVALHAQYELNGAVTPPEAVRGSAGNLTVTYTLTNTTAEQQDLAYNDAAGSHQTSTEPVFAPFAGTAVVTVPPEVEVISAKGAVHATDQAGNTVLSWNVSLFPPITSYQQQLVLQARTASAAIPAVSVRLAPVTSGKDPALGFTADALAASVTGNEKLYDGLAQLDDQAATLADGAGQLSQGLDSLASGTRQLAAGGDQLAQGLGGLASGADQVASGNQQLADALTQAATGARKLAAATRKLAAADTSAAGTAMSQLITGARGLAEGASQLADRFGSAADPALPNPLPAPDADTKCEPSRTTAPATAPSVSAATTPTATPGGAGGSDGVPVAPSPTVQPSSATPSGATPGASASATPSATGGAVPYDDDCVTLYQGVRALVAGLSQLATLAALINTEVANANAAAAAIRSGLTGIGTDSATAAAGAAALAGQLCGNPATLPPPACATLATVATAAGSAARQSAAMVEPLTALLTSLGKLTAYSAVLTQAVAASVTAGNQLLAGMDAVASALRSGSATQPGLAEGLAQLTSGLEKFASALASSSAQLGTALGKVAAGTGQLATGVSAAAKGADKLAVGAQGLASGAGQAADGATQLADGIATLASGADRVAAGGASLAKGAAQFQQQGTAKVADSVLTASTKPALAQAWLAAAGERAADAMPYGPPEGASGHVAYLMEIPAQDAPAPSLWDRLKKWLLG